MLTIFTMCLLVLLYWGLQYVFPNCSNTGIGETTVWNLCGKKEKQILYFLSSRSIILMTFLRIWFHINTISPGWWISLFLSPLGRNWILISQICPGLNANEIQIPYDKHHKMPSLVKCYQNTQFCQIWSTFLRKIVAWVAWLPRIAWNFRAYLISIVSQWFSSSFKGP